MTTYTARVCADCQTPFVAEDDAQHCPDCAEYHETVKNLPPPK